jgi:hypothetical protein
MADFLNIKINYLKPIKKEFHSAVPHSCELFNVFHLSSPCKESRPGYTVMFPFFQMTGFFRRLFPSSIRLSAQSFMNKLCELTYPKSGKILE